MRSVLNAIFYVAEGGIKWRMLPHDFPPMGTVYTYFRQWRGDGTLEKIHRKLRRVNRIIVGREPDESAGIIDSQSTKTTEEADHPGFDAGKKIKGRKRHLLVDTMGLVVEALVHSAGIQDRNGAKYLLNKAVTNQTTISKAWVDGGYSGRLIIWAKEKHNIDLEVVKRNDPHQFTVLARRWVVERTFAWISRYRRLAKDYERLKQTVEAWIYVAMTRIMLRRLNYHYTYANGE